MKNFFLNLPFIQNYIECMHKSFDDNGDGLHISRRWLLFSEYATSVSSNLTEGIFSTTLLLLLLENATTVEYVKFIAMHTAILSFAGMTQLLSPLLFERLKKRRKTIQALAVVSHVINIVILPLLVMLDVPTAHKAYLYIGACGIKQACGAICTPALSVWTMHNLPYACRSDYLVFRSGTGGVLSQVLTLLLAVFMDFFEAHQAALAGILIMRGIAVMAVAVQYIARNKIEEPEYNTDVKRVTLREMLTTPFSSKPFLVTVLIAMLWSFGNTLSGTYYNAYLLDDAKLSYTYISIFAIIGTPLNLLMLPKWNRFILRSGWLYGLAVSMVLYSFCYVFNGLVTENSAWLYMVSTIYCMVVVGGITLGNTNLPFLYMPKSMENSCLAFYNLCTSLAAMAAAAAAEKFCILTEGLPMNIFGLTLKNRAYICFISFLIMVLNAGIVWLLYRADRKNSV